MTIRRRVVAVLADVVGSSSEMERLGNVAGGAAVKARLDAIVAALLIADPSSTRDPVEGGDSILILGDHSAVVTAALFKAAVDHQEGTDWSVKARIAIGEGDAVDDDQHRGQMLNRIGKLLKIACRPGEVVITEAVRDSVAAEGKAHLLRSSSVKLPGLGMTTYWFVAARESMAPRDDEDRLGHALADIDRRVLALEQVGGSCERNNAANTTNIAANATQIAEVRRLVQRLLWAGVFILLGSVTAGLIVAVILLVSGAMRSALFPNSAPPAIARTAR